MSTGSEEWKLNRQSPREETLLTILAATLGSYGLLITFPEDFFACWDNFILTCKKSILKVSYLIHQPSLEVASNI